MLCTGGVLSTSIDTFESGNFNIPPWATSGTGMDVNSQAKYLGNYGAYIPLGTNYVYYAIPGGEKLSVDYNYWIYVASGANTSYYCLEQDSGTQKCSGSGNEIQVYYQRNGTGKIGYFVYDTNNGDSGNQTIVATTPQDAWYNILIHLDWNGTVIFRAFNTAGTMLGQTSHVFNATPTLKAVTLFGNDNTAYFDNVTFLGGVNESLNTTFSTTVNPIPATITLTDTTVPINVTINDWNWLVNETQSGILDNNLQNTSFSGATEYTDYNICLQTTGTGNITGNPFFSQTCSNVNTGKWFGDTNFTFFDETTGTGTTATLDFNGTQYTGTSFYLPSKQITNESTTNVPISFTITKTGHGTRYYTVDMNKYSDLNIGFVLLDLNKGQDTEFKFWETDQTTLLSNAQILILHKDKNRVVARRETNTNAEQTFFLNTADGNYVFYITASDGNTFTYNAISLTVNRPKAETTGLNIDANWNLYLAGLGATSDTNLSANSKILAIYSDTIQAFITTISSNNVTPEYYSRSYDMKSIGNANLTLQPYLVTTDESTQVKIITQQDDGAQIKPYSGLTIKIYKLIPNGGRSLVQQILTDAKGEGLSYLVVGGSYEFEIYSPDNNLLSFDGDTTPSIVIASATVYITIDTSSTGESYIGQKYWSVTWNPTKTYFVKALTGTQVFGFVLSNSDGADMNITAFVTQNDHNFVVYNPALTSSTTVTYNHAGINWTDINKGTITHTIILRVDGNTYIFTQSYVVQTSFGGYYDPIEGLKSGLREDFGCSTTGVCFPTLIIALLLCTGLVVFLALKTRMFGGQGSAIIFVIGLSLFTYLTWVPLELTLVVVIIVAAFVINDRGQRGEQ